MRMIEGFESSPIEDLVEGAVPRLPQYEGALDTLLLDGLTAETVFARSAKNHLTDLLKPSGIKLVMPEEGMALRPLWVWDHSVTLRVPLLLDKDSHDWVVVRRRLSAHLEELVQSLASVMLQKEKRVLLVGALQVGLRQVGDEEFTFRLKQKWSVES